jgi:hypothetical protein
LGEFKFILPRRGIGKSLSYIAPQEQFFKSTLIKKKSALTGYLQATKAL